VIGFLAAVALASSVSDIPNRDALSQCLIYLARSPEYASLSAEELGNSHEFFEAAEGRYCSDEASPLWRVAHQRARAKLGTDKPSLEGQKLAEEELHSILKEVWSDTQASGVALAPLSGAKMVDFAQSWLLDDRNAGELLNLAEQPILCVVDASKADSKMQEDIANGKTSAALKKARARCGYDSIQHTIEGKLQVRFPEMSPKSSTEIASSFLNDMTFQAMLSQ
jgi:hypothetical protein